ncbi:hypothetical protein Tco_0308090, partial [Tanacetum coccineum]
MEREAGIQLQVEKFDLMADAGDCEDIEEVNVNCIFMTNLQQASTSGSTDDSNVIPADSSVDPSGGELQHLRATIEETRTFYESLYNNLVIEVEKINTVNWETKEANVKLTVKLARDRGREKSFEFNQAKFDELENGYRKMEKLKNDFKTHEIELLDKLIESDKKITEINNILVKTDQSIQMMHMLLPKQDSFYHTEHKMALGYQIPFYLKQDQKKQQSLYNEKVLLDKHDPPVVYDSEETLQLAQESRLKMKQFNKEIRLKNYAKINKLLWVFVSKMAKSREKEYLLNTFKTASISNIISKPILIPDDKFSDDTPSQSVARKFLNEVKDTIATLQHVLKSKISLSANNWSSPAHLE